MPIDQARTSATGAHAADYDSPRPALFVVDDDVATLELLCEIGRDAGWLVRGFALLADLRLALRKETPTLIIIDDDLPDGRGGDLARELRGDTRTATVPTLVCTAAHPIRQAEIGSWAPVMSKPFDIAELEAYLDAAARRDRGSSAAGQRAG